MIKRYKESSFKETELNEEENTSGFELQKQKNLKWDSKHSKTRQKKNRNRDIKTERDFWWKLIVKNVEALMLTMCITMTTQEATAFHVAQPYL